MGSVKLDVDSRYAITKALGPVSIGSNTTTLSAAVDLYAYPGWKVLVVVATGTRTDGTFTPTVTESDTSGGSYTTATVFSGALTAISAADTTRKAVISPSKRFLKVSVASTSVTTGALLTAFLVLVPPTS